MTKRKGIILAGGSGKRLQPITKVISKHLLPVFDKPMIYYPLSTLMLMGISDILVITAKGQHRLFEQLLGNGKKWGISISYLQQMQPEGVAQALTLAKDFIDGNQSVLALGDNIFFGHGIPKLLRDASLQGKGATIFGYKVSNPQDYGVVEFDGKRNIIDITEKPINPRSEYVIPGLYFFDNTASKRAEQLNFSARNELEITDLLKSYQAHGKLYLELLGRGITWFDAGTPSSLYEASSFIKTVSERQSLIIGSPEEIAYKNGWMSTDTLKEELLGIEDSHYGEYLRSIIDK